MPVFTSSLPATKAYFAGTSKATGDILGCIQFTLNWLFLYFFALSLCSDEWFSFIYTSLKTSRLRKLGHRLADASFI